MLLDRVRRIPGVVDAGLTTGLPMHGSSSLPFTVVGQPIEPAHRASANLQAVSPTFFSTFGIRLVRGRFLSDDDKIRAPLVAMVNETFVRRYLPNDDPLASRLQFGFGTVARGANGQLRPGPPRSPGRRAWLGTVDAFDVVWHEERGRAESGRRCRAAVRGGVAGLLGTCSAVGNGGPDAGAQE